ncbi:MAG: YjbE family putative metal transport protein [Burkholderiales bacterium]|nr:YjbE family putative metal transport protein [Burkholderiales bacterium]
MSFSSPEFWIALLQIIGVNIILSGDNAVVIALAARSLPPAQQKKAVAWGSGAAVVMRIVLTIVAVELLRLPYLKLVGSVLLLWIALQLLLPEDEGEGSAQAGGNMMSAIRTILLADLVMSLDNVIAVAAAANGSMTLLVIGLAVSIPLVVFASTLLLTLMARFPVIITAGAALLGWVAGEMAIGDPAVRSWIDVNAAYLHYAAPALGAVGVVLLGTWLARRVEARRVAAPAAVAATPPASGMRRVLLAVDGSEGAARAVRHLLAMRAELRDPDGVELHLVNVQPPLSGDVSAFIAAQTRDDYHRERCAAALAPARELLDRAGFRYQLHEPVGDPGPTIAALADTLGADLIVMGTRGLGGHVGSLLGSVAQRTVEHAAVPVLLAK